MPIHPLPQFEEDVAQLEAEDRKVYEALQAPKTIVVRFGAMKMIGEFPWKSDVKPGCGSKIVIRSFRGTEIGEMLTSTCPNSGCTKSVSRKEMLEYIENSGGRQYPFHTSGRAIRVASGEDMQAQEKLEQSRHGLKMEARRVCEQLRLDLKIADAEPILGGETVTYYYLAEERREVGPLRAELEKMAQTRVDLKQVGARDEARLTADYERCGQYCCCKNFLKVLKPVSMKSAKIQKATLDPLKISGRCGRLMCCLRYEDQTYADLRARLPHRRSRVGTPDGDGTVIDTQILTQLALVRMDADGRDVAVPVEELTEPGQQPAPKPAAEGRTRRPERGERGERPGRGRGGRGPGAAARSGAGGSGGAAGAAGDPAATRGSEQGSGEAREGAPEEGAPRRRRRRRRKSGDGRAAGSGPAAGADQTSGAPDEPRPPRAQRPEGDRRDTPSDDGGGTAGQRRRRRRKRRRGGGSGGGGGEGAGGGAPSGGSGE